MSAQPLIGQEKKLWSFFNRLQASIAWGRNCIKLKWSLTIMHVT